MNSLGPTLVSELWLMVSKDMLRVRGAPWSATNRLHGQRTGAFSWRPVLGLSRKSDQFRFDPTQNCAPGWWCDRESSVYHLALEMWCQTPFGTLLTTVPSNCHLRQGHGRTSTLQHNVADDLRSINCDVTSISGMTKSCFFNLVDMLD